MTRPETVTVTVERMGRWLWMWKVRWDHVMPHGSPPIGMIMSGTAMTRRAAIRRARRVIDQQHRREASREVITLEADQ